MSRSMNESSAPSGKKGPFPYPVLILGIIPHPPSFLNPLSREIFLTNPISRGSRRPYPVSRETLSGAPQWDFTLTNL